ncbi:MAG TPA: M1 family aminopeptidase [Bacteroidia bacterium]
MRFVLSVIVLFGLQLNAQNIKHKDYWKNRKPYPSYWQQDVHYIIEAEIIDTANLVKGSETLVYFNNSPDKLNRVYFHLYQNAFQPGSYAHELNEVNHEQTSFGSYEAKKLGTIVSSMTFNGKPVNFKLDNTILIVDLPEAIEPNTSAEFNMNFTTHWDNGSMRRRFKTFMTDDSSKHFDGVHWYPRICVYDRKFGWETDQHLGKEFYGDYGVYDVKLTFPSEYVVEATGALTNENDVMPASLRQKLDISNYSDSTIETITVKENGQQKTLSRVVYKPNNYKFNTPKGYKKTWIYHAENVHDFAFTADPKYRIGEKNWNGIRCIALAQEQNAAYWRPTANFVANVVKIYSTDFGMYGYPKIVAADARDGMEYPMITLNGGNWPDHKYVIAHEVGHNWFYGMIGNNETYRAMLDEGFTQFLTSWSIKKINGIPMYPNSLDDQYVYQGYLYDAANKSDMPLNTHSDDFSSATGHGGGYRHVYYKTATMLYNLQYVLGDELFLNAMKHYFDKWKFAHPYPEDFRQSIIEYTKVDLNWFFDQWMETTKTIDYKIVSVKKIGKTEKGEYKYKVKLKRKGEMQMPIDLKLTDRNGSTSFFTIPNTYFNKSNSGQVLKTWKGWGDLNRTYVDTITLNSKYEQVEIDPSHRLADVYRIDNVKRRGSYRLPYKTKLNTGRPYFQGFNHQTYEWRPDMWFNAVDGLKIGIAGHFEYARNKHVLDYTFWYNSGFGAEKKYSNSERLPLSYKLLYKNLVGRDAYIFWDTRLLDGLFYDRLGFEKSFGKNKFSFYYKSIGMISDLYWPYLNSNDRNEKSNSSVNIDYTRNYRYKRGDGVIKSTLRGNGLSKDFSYAFWKFEVVNNNHLGKIDIRTRYYFQHIEGSNIPEESMLNLAGANMEEMLESKFTRSRGYIPETWLGYGNSTNHFQIGGGLNLRGYAGYLAPVMSNGNQYHLYNGNGGTSASIEIDFDRLFKIRPKFTRNWLKIDLYAFADAGVIYNSNILSNSNIVSPLRADAGLGVVANIYRWGNRSLIQPFALRFDVPMLLNTPPYSDKGYFAQRWILGIGRSF